ncbi:hypothetical protein [Salinimonas marina]|uniref:hypothetical protein n=1 Tax=Salinimonas marina TaxID=2785918 RepID=UPI001E43FB0A|nr:hypothetical protein [Salinimonas marina]
MKKRILSVTTAALMVSACNSTPPTQAEREFANEMRQAMLSKLQQAGPGHYWARLTWATNRLNRSLSLNQHLPKQSF